MNWGDHVDKKNGNLNPTEMDGLRRQIDDSPTMKKQLDDLQQKYDSGKQFQVGTLVKYGAIGLGGLVLYDLIKDHQKKISGCFKAITGRQPCKVGKWSVDSTGGTCEPHAQHKPIVPADETTNMNDLCKMACDNDKLTISDTDKNAVLYTCQESSIVESVGDMVGGGAGGLVGGCMDAAGFDPASLQNVSCKAAIIAASVGVVAIVVAMVRSGSARKKQEKQEAALIEKSIGGHHSAPPPPRLRTEMVKHNDE
jgi:hypothetical protein